MRGRPSWFVIRTDGSRRYTSVEVNRDVMRGQVKAASVSVTTNRDGDRVVVFMATIGPEPRDA